MQTQTSSTNYRDEVIKIIDFLESEKVNKFIYQILISKMPEGILKSL